MIGSILPDFDFLPGILIGEPAAFHHGASHSFAFAVLFGALVCITLHLCAQKNAGHGALLGSVAYGLHSVLDSVSANNSVPLVWPLVTEKIGMNLNLFGHFHMECCAMGQPIASDTGTYNTRNSSAVACCVERKAPLD